jgi:hypothetical protein
MNKTEAESKLTFCMVNELLAYDPLTGLLSWKKYSGKQRPRDVTDRYSVAPQTIWRIQNQTGWSHITKEFAMMETDSV